MNKKQCSQPSKNNAAAGYQGPVKIMLLKVAGLLRKISERAQTWAATKPDAREKRYVRGRRVWYSVLFFETRSTIIINIFRTECRASSNVNLVLRGRGGVSFSFGTLIGTRAMDFNFPDITVCPRVRALALVTFTGSHCKRIRDACESYDTKD